MGVAVAALAAACRTAPPVEFSQRERLSAADARFELHYTEYDRDAAPVIRRAVENALPRLRRWGEMKVPFRVEVYPTHEALERAVDRPGYAWLRAWARYRVVYLQAPRTWSLLGASAAQVEELIAHELTHCLMYQLAASEFDWPHKGIPIWFREGMASVTAQQGYRRGALADLARSLRGGGSDLIGEADALYQSESDAVYTAAHHAFAFLVLRYGDDGVRQVLREMSAGRDFDAAFMRAIGLERPAFEAEFARYVRMEGWRAERQRARFGRNSSSSLHAP